MTDARATQAKVEALADRAPQARATQAKAEVVATGTPSARATQAKAEVVAGGSPQARLDQVQVEVLVGTVPSLTGVPFDGIKIEIMFDGLSWVDVSDRLGKAPVKIRQGRPDPLADVAPGSLSLQLDNLDGALMPDNTLSPWYPNVGELRRIRVTLRQGRWRYTRFAGWITGWLPSFPTAAAVQSVVHVTALDDLSVWARRSLYSVWVEAARKNAAGVGARADMFILKGDGFATQYFDNVTSSSGTKMRATTVAASLGKGQLSFGEAEGLSVDGAATFGPAADNTGTVIKMEMDGTHRLFQVWVKIPSSQQVDAGTPSLEIVAFWNATNSTSYGSIRLRDNGGSTDAAWYNGAGSYVGTIASSVNDERWVLISVVADAPGTGALVTWEGSGSLSVSLPWGSVKHVWLGGQLGLVPKMIVAGPIMIANRTAAVAAIHGLTGGTPWTAADRMASLDLVVTSTPPVVNAGSAAGSVSASTGNWHGRTALAVGQEIARSGAGVLWARGIDGRVTHVQSDATYPVTPVATVDIERDAAEPPELSRDLATRPSRLTVAYPGGKVLVIDGAREAAAGGQEASGRTIETIVADYFAAESLGLARLARIGTAGIRISRLVIDLETSENNLVPALFASPAPAGLYPTCRIRVSGLPTDWFSGSSTRDVFAEGWTETYSNTSSTIEIDCSPA